MHDEDAVDAAGGEARGRRGGLDGAQVGEVLAPRAVGQEAHHVRRELGRDHLAVGDDPGEPHREVPSAGPDVGDRHRGFELERAHHVVGALPGVAPRIVEHLGPGVGVDERAVRPPRAVTMVRMPVGVTVRPCAMVRAAAVGRGPGARRRRDAARRDAPLNVGAQRRQRHLAEAREQQRFDVLERPCERGVDRLLDGAAGRLRPVPHREQRGSAERGVHVAQGHLREVARQPPPATVALGGLDMALRTQPGQHPADHHGIGVHGPREDLGRHRAVRLRHVQQHVQHARKSAVSSHVTYIVS